MTDRTRPVLDQINLVARDMPAMVEFYRRLGLDIADTLPEWEPHHRSTVATGGADFDLDSEAFAAVWDQGWVRSGTAAVLGFRLPTRATVDEMYADLTGAGYRAQQPPYDAFWGARYAVVEDPDGNAVGLMSPADPSRRTAPPAPPE